MNIKDALNAATGKIVSPAVTSTEAQSMPREYNAASTHYWPTGPSLTACGTVSTFRHWLLLGLILILLLAWAFVSGWLIANHQNRKPASAGDRFPKPDSTTTAASR